MLEQLRECTIHRLVSPRNTRPVTRRWTPRKARGLEGIVAKRSDSPYEIGRRSNVWRKLKYRPQQEFVVGGWVPGTGNHDGEARPPDDSTTDGSCMTRAYWERFSRSVSCSA